MPRLRARRGGRHSAHGVHCGPADVWMASVRRRPRWVTVRPSRPARLAPLLRPPPDGRCARHATPCSGAVRCGHRNDTELRLPLASNANRQCRRSRTQCTPGVSTTLGASTVMRGASRSAARCGGRSSPVAPAGRQKRRPEGTPGGIGRSHSESCRPAQSALDPVTPAARRAERGPRSAGGAQAARPRSATCRIRRANVART